MAYTDIPLQYGLLYHSSFISRAGPKHKGRISRFLANKCSIASRIDCYSGEFVGLSVWYAGAECRSLPFLFPLNSFHHSSTFIPHPTHHPDTPTPKFGEALRAQVEERLNFFETGQPPSKNSDAMRKVLESLGLVCVQIICVSPVSG
jgi:nucleolar protein 56